MNFFNLGTMGLPMLFKIIAIQVKGAIHGLRIGQGVKTGVSRSYRKLIRLRRMEDNGHYHCFPMGYAIVRYLPLTQIGH